MPSPSQETVTRLLHAAHEGDDAAFDELMGLVYEELRHLARLVRRGRAGATLNTTALVHEAYQRLLPSKDLSWHDRTHFFRVAARAMRQVITRAARDRMRLKRGGGGPLNVTFNEAGGERLVGATVSEEEVAAISDAIDRLAAFAPRQAQVVECRFFAGLTLEETAEALAIGTSTVKRDWQTARAWLKRELS